jgi:hypothetical protein
MNPTQRIVTAFRNQRHLASGPLPDVALKVRAALADNPQVMCLVFDDQTGRVVDLDLRGSGADVLKRLLPDMPPAGRGRPVLGVVAREVTLLTQQWDWLARDSRNVSATLRRLIDEARRREGPQPRRKQVQEAAYRFMTAMAGDQPGYEEATRMLFAGDWAAFDAAIEAWPSDVADYARRLAEGGWRNGQGRGV